MKEILDDREYIKEEVETLTLQLANTITDRVERLQLQRCKIITNVILGEDRGQGVESKVALHWDSSIDSLAWHNYLNVSSIVKRSCHSYLSNKIPSANSCLYLLK